MGNYFQHQLKALSTHPLVGEVRGRGLLAAVELVADKTTGEAFKWHRGCVYSKSLPDNGLIVRTVAGSSIAFCPPLIINRQQIDEIIERLPFR